jgi:hypothetical protein
MQDIETRSREFDARLRLIVGKSNEQTLIDHLRAIVGSPFLEDEN